jgi:arginine-tRNA-protein transferase
MPNGAVHFKYYYDNKLIAVSVADLVPDMYHSMYFFYDPELQLFKKSSPGINSALIEIEYVKEMNKYFPKFK